MKKVQAMASDSHKFVQSALNKIREFKSLAYPNTTLKGVCSFLAATTGNDAWITVRNSL